MRLTIIRMMALLLALFAAQSVNADFEAGQRALDAGNIDEAVAQWRESANAGDGRAMLELGQLYLQGLGVIQDYVEAHKWFNLAASRGVGEALEARDTLAAKMTPDQLAMAQQRAVAWQSGGSTQTGESPPDGASTADAGQPPPQASDTLQPQIRPDALHNAAQAGDIEMLKAAITAGVDVNARDSRGRTALMHAVDKGYLLLASQLLDAQADVNVRAPDGATALFMAAAHGHTEIIELLMKAGADVSIRGLKGATPVEVARTRYGDVNAARGNGEPEAVLALLDGKTWAEVKEERVQVELAVKQLPDEMVSIPAGKFRMGSRGRDADDDEKPKHRVTVPAFKLGKYEVTVGQFRAFVVATGYRTDAERNTGGEDGCWTRIDSGDWGWNPGSSWRNPGYAVADDQPVVCISSNDAQAFIEWLNSKTGGNYRLPTEAEWEYATRAGSKKTYSWGDDIGSNLANCNGCGSTWDNRRAAPVGSFPANAWGLHDMHGNAWEWVQDCWNGSYKGAPKDGSAWMSGDCSRRVVRGGSWLHLPWGLRSAGRDWSPRTYRVDFLGFRLAQDQ